MDDYLEKITKKKEPQDHPQYEPPAIITYDGDDILEEIGPAQTVTGPPAIDFELEFPPF